MRRHHASLLVLGGLLLVLFFVSQTQYNVQADESAQALNGMIFTMYHPIASDTGNKTVEGGGVDRFGKPIVTATDIEARRAQGDTTAGDINHPITLAADISHTGEIYFIPSYSFTTINPDGTTQSHTVTNFYGRVSDTGSAFTDRPEKIDIATDHAPSQEIANRQDRLPNNTATVQFIPANSRAREFAANQGTRTTTIQEQPQTPSIPVTQTFNQAPAQGFSGAPLWITFPLCFKATGPASIGFVAKAPSCNGGLVLPPPPATVPVPVLDCGPHNALCQPPNGTPLGCLNAVCAGSPNAIFDPITKTCGCG